MSTALREGGVEKYRFKKERKPIYETIEIYTDVVSEKVCMSQCLPKEAVNSGIYDPRSKNCQCILMASFCRSLFANKIDIFNDQTPSLDLNQNSTEELDIFIKMNAVSQLSSCLSGKAMRQLICIIFFSQQHNIVITFRQNPDRRRSARSIPCFLVQQIYQDNRSHRFWTACQ